MNLAGSVTTPDQPVRADNEMTRRLDACSTVAEMDELRVFALRHGYHPDGQFFAAWFAKAEVMLGEAFAGVVAQVMPELEAKRAEHRQNERAVLERKRAEIEAALAALPEG